MKQLQVTILILIANNFISCMSFMSNKEFVEKFNHENFEAFKSTSIFIRGSANDDSQIVFAYDETISPSLNNGAYIVNVDDRTKQIKSTSCHLMKDSTIVDKKKLEQLVLKFVEYPIGYLSVDSSNNVLISLRANTSPDLIRFSDMKYKIAAYDKWVSVKDNWYEKKEAK